MKREPVLPTELAADYVADGGWKFAGLAINEAVQRLCKKWGTTTVYDHLKAWVAYMDRQLEIMERHGHIDGQTDG